MCKSSRVSIHFYGPSAEVAAPETCIQVLFYISVMAVSQQKAQCVLWYAEIKFVCDGAT
jgi:hypothetical protein